MTDRSVSPAGLYLHIPFCEKKCAYCDFYSSFTSEELLDEYTAALKKSIRQWGGVFNRPIDTIYFGGGTPSLLNRRLIEITDAVRKSFDVTDNAEITLEANPGGNIEEMLKSARIAGINRLSVGVQSGNDNELKILGRTHTAADAADAVSLARRFGFSNISLDLMLGLPFSDKNSLLSSLRFITSLTPEHISAYILKLEPNTRFFHDRDKLLLPNDDDTAEQYLYMCDYLEKGGYNHYEISNFGLYGYESRHNKKYWTGGEYLGIGPAAHSFVDEKRFFYERDLRAFINGSLPVPDGNGGSTEEYIMLRLRLKEGIIFDDYKITFGNDLPKSLTDKAKLYSENGLVNFSDNGFSLTDSGMLVSNSIITELLECTE